MQVILYKNFSKRVNSLKLPIDESIVTTRLNCTLKESTSVNNPVLIINEIPDINSYTYCYINDFNEYYYIKDIVYTNGRIYNLILIKDVLASNYYDILSTKCYVQYAESGYNLFIADGRFEHVQDKHVEYSSSILFNDFYYKIVEAGQPVRQISMNYMPNNPSIIIENIAGPVDLSPDIFKKPTSISTMRYITSRDEFLKYVKFSTFDGKSDIQTAIQNYINDVSNATISVKASPFHINPTDTTINIAGVNPGDYSIYGIKGNSNLEDNISVSSKDIIIPHHFRDWRDFKSDYRLYLPFLGYQDIENVAIFTTLRINMSYNVLTGDLRYIVLGDGTFVLMNKTVNIATDIAMPSSNYAAAELQKLNSSLNLIGSLASIGMGAATANPMAIASGSLSAVSSIASFEQSGKINQQISGVSGGIEDFYMRNAWIDADNQQPVAVLEEVFNYTTFEPNDIKSIKGLPVFKSDFPSNYTGFFQATDFYLNNNANPDDKNEISSLIASGIYID